MKPLLHALLVLVLLLQLSFALPSAPVIACWKALSLDLCTVQDGTGICASKFQQDSIVDPAYRVQLFNYLVERYVTLTVGTSIETLLSFTLSPLNTTYAAYLDSAYGVACNSDPGVQGLLSVGVSESNAASARYLWLLTLQQASFCSANEIWILNQGCVCKEDKDCDELSDSEHGSLLKAIGLVLAIFVVIQVFTYVSLLRQIWTIFGGYDAIKSSIEYLSRKVKDSQDAKISASMSGLGARPSPSPSLSSLQSATGAMRRVSQLNVVKPPVPPTPSWPQRTVAAATAPLPLAAPPQPSPPLHQNGRLISAPTPGRSDAIDMTVTERSPFTE